LETVNRQLRRQARIQARGGMSPEAYPVTERRPTPGKENLAGGVGFSLDRTVGFGFGRIVDAFGNLLDGSQTVHLSNGPWATYASNQVTITQTGLYLVRLSVSQSSTATARTLIGWDWAYWWFPLGVSPWGADYVIPLSVGDVVGDVYLTNVDGAATDCLVGLYVHQLIAA
jgi:hypothetical protein